jgi:Ca2+-transporting ATPase
VSPWPVLRAQFQNLLILILLIATAVSAYLGEVVEAIAIGVIVGFAILLGFVQEYRAERAIAALRKMTAPVARVLRGGTETEVPAQDLVPGDVVLLGAGDKVPADGRLVEAVNLKLNESALTGESVPVEKVQEILAGDTLPLAERRNMVYAGTAVTYGRGRALIVATGMQTELGRITGLLKGVKASKTLLQENLDRVGRALAAAALAVVSLIVALGLLRGARLMEMFMFGIALAVAVVPEALPAAVTISLALGVERMAKRNALVRHLPAVETLGAITVILSDKTGTLTRDEMTARRLWVHGQEIAITGGGYTPEGRFTIDGAAIRPALPVMDCLRAAALCSDARLIEVDGGFEVKGDPTEAALVVAAAKAGLDPVTLETHWPRIGEIPFSSERKRMTTLHRGRSGVIACSKGAPEMILASCTRGRAAYGTMALDEATHHAVREAAQAMAARALRVLAVAHKRNAGIGDAECKMVFLGLIGLIDPPRAEAAQAIETCKAAGIRPVMITGDHPNTGAAVAKEIGLLKSGRVVTGAELEAMSAPSSRARSQGSRSTRASPPSTSCGWCGPGSRTATSSP